MKIEDSRELNKEPFFYLACGDIFEAESTENLNFLYMKVYSRENSYNAVKLLDGHLCNFHDDIVVHKVNHTLTLLD